MAKRSPGSKPEDQTGLLKAAAPIADDERFKSFAGDVLANPDPILRHEAGGRSYELYREMRQKDLKLNSLLDTRMLAVVGKPAEIQAPSESPLDIEITEFVKHCLNKRLRGFRLRVTDLLEAIPMGFAVSEIMWAVEDGKYVIADLESKSQERFLFGKNRELRLRRTAYDLVGEEVDRRKFVTHTHDAESGSPYGSAVCRDAYWAIFFKKTFIRTWAIFGEKRAFGVFQIKLPKGASKTLKDEAEKLAKDLQTETGVRVPDDVVIEFIELKSTVAVETWSDFIKLMDLWLAQLVLGQTLTSDQGDKGTQALGNVHNEVRQDRLEADADAVCLPINNLIELLVTLNYGPQKEYPAYVINYEPPDDLNARAERDKIVVGDLGLPVAKSYFYETYDIPEPEPGDELLEKPQPVPFGGLPGAPGAPGEPNPEKPPLSELADPAGNTHLANHDADVVYAGGFARASDWYEQNVIGPVIAAARKKKALSRATS